MKVALYSSHHFLPFWHTPQNPDGIYNPANLNDWRFLAREAEEEDVKAFPANEHWVMPILNGLFSLDLPGVMAHVSMIFNFREKVISVPKRVWVQITTEASEQTAEGLPIVVKDDEVQVKNLWGGDNKTYNPFQLLDKEKSIDEIGKRLMSEFWTTFFLEKLQQTKKQTSQEANEARAEAERVEKLYSIIP